MPLSFKEFEKITNLLNERNLRYSAEKRIRIFLLKNRQGQYLYYLVEIIAVCQKKEIYSVWLQRSKAGPQCESYRMGELNQHKRYKKDSCLVVKRLPPEVVIFSYILS